MIKNAGGDPWFTSAEDTYGYDIYGFPGITGIIEDTPVLNAVTSSTSMIRGWSLTALRINLFLPPATPTVLTHLSSS